MKKETRDIFAFVAVVLWFLMGFLYSFLGEATESILSYIFALLIYQVLIK